MWFVRSRCTKSRFYLLLCALRLGPAVREETGHDICNKGERVIGREEGGSQQISTVHWPTFPSRTSTSSPSSPFLTFSRAPTSVPLPEGMTISRAPSASAYARRVRGDSV